MSNFHSFEKKLFTFGENLILTIISSDSVLRPDKNLVCVWKVVQGCWQGEVSYPVNWEWHLRASEEATKIKDYVKEGMQKKSTKACKSILGHSNKNLNGLSNILGNVDQMFFQDFVLNTLMLGVKSPKLCLKFWIHMCILGHFEQYALTVALSEHFTIGYWEHQLSTTVSSKNKLASLGATLVRNSAHWLNDLLTDRGKV